MYQLSVPYKVVGDRFHFLLEALVVEETLAKDALNGI